MFVDKYFFMNFAKFFYNSAEMFLRHSSRIYKICIQLLLYNFTIWLWKIMTYGDFSLQQQSNHHLIQWITIYILQSYNEATLRDLFIWAGFSFEKSLFIESSKIPSKVTDYIPPKLPLSFSITNFCLKIKYNNQKYIKKINLIPPSCGINSTYNNSSKKI